MASALLNLSSSQSRRRKGKEEERGREREKGRKKETNVKKRQMKREEVVMRMAKSPRECARAAGWMREIEARGSVPRYRDASIYSCKRTATRSKFRSFSSSSIDRGIGIDRIGVEKATLDFIT